MSATDRLQAGLLFALAGAAWLAVAVLFTNVSPVDDATAQLAGALLLGAAVGVSSWPLAWLLARTRPAGRSPGAWSRAGRRAGLAGLVVAIVVILRGLGTFSLPMALFVVGTAVLVELAFLLRR